MTHLTNHDRRRFMLGSAGLIASGGLFGATGLIAAGPAQAASLTRTPRQTEGPFYPERIPIDHDADLLQVRGKPNYTGGTPLYLTGSVVDPSGRPLKGVRVEIWQCDGRGYYHHSGDRGGRADPAFQGYGRARSVEGGRWAFRTIRPASYPGRTPHIHFKLSGQGIEGLTTQMYVAGDPGNRRDFLLNNIRDPKAKQSVLVAMKPLSGKEAGALTGDFRIVVGVNATR